MQNGSWTFCVPVGFAGLELSTPKIVKILLYVFFIQDIFKISALYLQFVVFFDYEFFALALIENKMVVYIFQFWMSNPTFYTSDSLNLFIIIIFFFFFKFRNWIQYSRKTFTWRRSPDFIKAIWFLCYLQLQEILDFSPLLNCVNLLTDMQQAN